MAARQEQDRKAAIGAIAAVLRERDANAIELEAAIARVAELFVKISSIRVDKLWSFERGHSNRHIGIGATMFGSPLR